VIIRNFDVSPCTMRKEDPAWRFALAANPVTEGQVVRIATEDGAEGFGYASATAHMGSTLETLKAELDFFRPLILGKDPRNIELILRELGRSLRGASQAKAAIDCALHDLVARSLGIPLNLLFGGAVRDGVAILRILAIKTPSEMAAQAQKLIDKGYRHLKIKVHGDVRERTRASGRASLSDAVTAQEMNPDNQPDASVRFAPEKRGYNRAANST
jgi:L-Ala-D/L-Glu epimerase